MPRWRFAPRSWLPNCLPSCIVLYPNGSAGAAGDVGRYGHGLGIQLTEPPSHTSWDKTVLKSGMALTLEPSISYGDGLVMVAEENLLMTEDGHTLLSARAPRDLPVITPHRLWAD